MAIITLSDASARILANQFNTNLRCIGALWWIACHEVTLAKNAPPVVYVGELQGAGIDVFQLAHLVETQLVTIFKLDIDNGRGPVLMVALSTRAVCALRAVSALPKLQAVK